jgi:hypothetical protein
VVSATRAEAVRTFITLDEIEGLTITILAPSRRSISILLGFGFVLTALDVLIMFVGGLCLLLIRDPGPPSHDELMLMVLAPSLGIVFAVAAWSSLQAWLWQRRGREIIRINDDELIVTLHGKLGKPPELRCLLAEVSNMRYAPNPLSSQFGLDPAWIRSRAWLGSLNGRIAFDWRDQTHRFGYQLDEFESRRLIRTIKDRYKIPEDTVEPFPVERL